MRSCGPRSDLDYLGHYKKTLIEKKTLIDDGKYHYTMTTLLLLSL